MRPGDVFMTNGPYGGGTHTADVALVMPIFAGDEVIAFGISVTHWTEIGGKVLGSLSPDSTEIFQEGLQFPQLRLYRGGELNAELIALIRDNVRLPTMSIGDLSAGVAAVRIAAERLGGIVDRYGLAATKETFTAILAHGETIARDALRHIPPGVYEADRRHRRRRHQRGSDPGSGRVSPSPPSNSSPTSPERRRRPMDRSTAPAAR